MNTHPMDYAAIETQSGLAGNVYFLAPVNFENAAFCKIGRAKNDPEARCAQINKSSTGDVLWGVRHVVTVDDHIRLEGSAKGGGNWLITDFILSELARPTIELIKAKVDAGRIQLTLACDAWQGASRYDIVEHLIGGRRPLLSEIDAQLWRQMLIQAKGCLDPSRQFRARATQTVTVLDTEEKRLAAPPMGGVSPHLVITTPVEVEPGWDDDRLDAAMDQAITRLRPVYEWVSRTAE